MNNSLIIACAGSGKTTKIVNEALSLQGVDKKILITTFTDENCEEIRRKLISRVGYVPENVDILPWFTFEIKHLIKPYLLPLITKEISGVNMVQQMSAVFTGQNNMWHYMDKDGKLYSDKIALLAIRSIENNRDVIVRLKDIYEKIYVDEFQDLAGYDLDLLKKFMEEDINLTIVGDPRQKTFSTHFSKHNIQYNDCPEQFIKDKCSKLCIIDDKSLNCSYRCPESVISYASQLFPHYPISHSAFSESATDGLYLVKESDVPRFIKQEKGTVQLRLNVSKKVRGNSRIMNFGKSKGATYQNVLIYPTEKILKAVLEDDLSVVDTPTMRSKFYVALTRAEHKVGIVVQAKHLAKCQQMQFMIWGNTS